MVNAARLLGPGRAGRSLADALTQRGWTVDLVGRDRPVLDAAVGVDVVVLAVPDDAIATVAAAIRPVPDTVVLHLSGSRGLDVLAPHPRVGSLHPLASLPDPVNGARRLLSGCTFAVAGDPAASRLVEALGGRAVVVADADRVRYHAAAAVASNHLVALTAQVERLALSAGVPADLYWPMMRDTLDNVARLGSKAALTGPASRGDVGTVRAHLDALPAGEHDLYLALAAEAARVGGSGLSGLTPEASR